MVVTGFFCTVDVFFISLLGKHTYLPSCKQIVLSYLVLEDLLAVDILVVDILHVDLEVHCLKVHGKT